MTYLKTFAQIKRNNWMTRNRILSHVECMDNDARSLQHWTWLPQPEFSVSGIPLDKDYRKGMTSLSRRECRRQSETADYVNRKANVIQIACLAYIFRAIPYRRAAFLFRVWSRLHARYLKPRITWRANYISMRCSLSSRRKYLLPPFLELM